MTGLTRVSIVVLSLVAVSCSAPDAPVPDGLHFSVQTDTRVEGSLSHDGAWIEFSSIAVEAEHPDIVVTGAGGVVLRSSDGRFVLLGAADLTGLDEAGVPSIEPAVAAFLRSAEAELIALLFRHIDTATAELGPALAALYTASSALETGISGEPLLTEPPDEARACWNRCCGTDCDCNHHNPCSWWDPTCNWCARHDACIHYWRDHRGWANAAATAWCS